MKEYEAVVGLEVHIQLKTQTKVFCSCAVDPSALPNTNICPICCGYPGVLPVLNRKALVFALKLARALNCRINRKIYFERKNYFYPDLPKNYQISQYQLPLGEEGYLEIPSGKKIKIKRVHLEEDAGKLIHKEGYSLVDFNRAGIPLLEIVTHPDINSPDEAYEYLTQLKLTVQYLGISDCDMEKGSLRCDANISIRLLGEEQLGVKTEVKNMNSFKGVRDALHYELHRQIGIVKNGERIQPETRLWDDTRKITLVMRSKEESHDYRYFPEPDLVNFVITEDLWDEGEFVGELPLYRRNRFKKDYNLSDSETDVLVSDKKLADFFEEIVNCYPQPKKISNWLLGVFLELFNSAGCWGKIKISASNFAKIVKYFDEGVINNIGVRKVLEKAVFSGDDVDKIIDENNLRQVSSQDVLNDIIDEVITENPKPVADYKNGKKGAIMFLVGQIMKKTQGRSNPKVVKELLERRLG